LGWQNLAGCVELPGGWQADRPEDSSWDMIWGPEFYLRSSDDSEDILTLPLSPKIEIYRPLATSRQWLD